MKNYIRYISKNLVTNFLIILFIFVLMIWLTQSLRFIELITAKGVELFLFLELIGYLVIPMAYVAIPLALLVATVIVLNNLKLNKELIILKTSGLSTFQIFMPFFLIAFIVMIFHCFISFYMMPYSYKKFKDMQGYLKDNVISTLFEEGVFNSQTNSMTIYISKKEQENHFEGIFIYDFRNPMRPATTIADKGELIFTKEGLQFILYNGSHQIEDKKNNKISLTFFEHYKFSFKNEVLPSSYKTLDANEMYIPQLLSSNGKNEKEYQSNVVNANQRIVWPLYCLLLPLIAISVMLQGQYMRKDNWIKTFIASFCGGGAIALFLLFNNLALRNYNLLITMSLCTLVSFIIPMIIIYRADYK